MSTGVFDNRRTLHFEGDNADRLVGRVMGPTLQREQWTVTEAVYDPATNVTTARLLPTTQPDVDALDPSCPPQFQRTTNRDEVQG